MHIGLYVGRGFVQITMVKGKQQSVERHNESDTEIKAVESPEFMYGKTPTEQSIENDKIEEELYQVFENEKGVPSNEMPWDHKHAVTRWQKKYGITEVPLLCRSVDGKIYDDKRLKGVFWNNNYRRIVSRHYVVVPNEEVEEMVNRVIKVANEEAGNTLMNGLKLEEKYESHYKDAKYWRLLNANITEQIDYKGEGDKIKIGCIVRNSVGAKVALGADLYTHRVICDNGAVARGNDMGFALKHVGNLDAMLNSFKIGIEKVLNQALELVEYYRKSAKMRMNKKIAQEWSKVLPQNVFPHCMKMDKNTNEVMLLREDNLWESFNQITETAWHNNKSEYLTKSHVEQNAHRVLIAAVQGRYA